jgi:serine protease Do
LFKPCPTAKKEEKREENRKMSDRCKLRARTWIGSIFVLAIIGTCTWAVATYGGQANNTQAAWYMESPATPAEKASSSANASQEPIPAAAYARELSSVFHNAAEKVSPSVVMITNAPAVVERPHSRGDKSMPPDDKAREFSFGFKGTPFGELFNNPQFRQFFNETPEMPNMPGRRGIMGAGSGVIVDPSGVILTNNHVVEGGGKIMVRLQDGREFRAVDIKTDPSTDIAVLRIEGAGTLQAAKLGDSDATKVGDWVLALGQPFGLQGTVTAGIISAKGRGLGTSNREDFIQTDAAINPGNSGGPLVDLSGEVIGINTAITTSSGAYQGVGFAIPIDLAKWVGKQLVESGSVRRAYLGVVIQPVTQPLASQFHVKVHQGVVVTEVRPDSPADKAGLKTGDIVLQFAGKSVSGPRELQSLVEQTKIGNTAPLVILRDGKQMTLNATTAELPSETNVAESPAIEGNKGETTQFDKLGIQAETLTPKIAEQLGVSAEHGAVITDVRSGTPADMAGLSTGMIITEANRRPVNSVDDLRKALGEKPLEKGVLLLLRTPEGSRYVAIEVENQ